MVETWLPLVIKYILIPQIAKVMAGTPGITEDQIIAKLPEDVQALCTSNQAFLDSIRTAAGR